MSSTSTIVLTHPSGPSLISLTKSQITAQSTLSLPSRFPKASSPEVIVSPTTGHIFVWSKLSGIIWEYDARGRRIGEMSPGGAGNGGVEAIGIVSGGEGVGEKLVVAVGMGIKVMRKQGAWRCVQTIEGFSDNIERLVVSPDGSTLVVVLNSGEAHSVNMRDGIQTRLDLTIADKITFNPASPNTLVYPHQSSLVVMDLTNKQQTRLKPFGYSGGHIRGITFSPIVEGKDGTKKGGLCAVLGSGGEVALVGLSTPESAPKMISFGKDVETITFLDGASLAGRTREGNLLVKDLRALSAPAKEISVSSPIIGVYPLPAVARASRSSLAPSVASTVAKKTPLGETRNAGNVPTPPPPVPSLPPKHTLSKDKGKARAISPQTTTVSPDPPVQEIVITENQTRREVSPITTILQKEKPRSTRFDEPASGSEMGMKSKSKSKSKDRAVSAPQERPITAATSGSTALTSGLRSTSNPVAGSSRIQRRPSLARLSSVPTVQEEEGDDQQEEPEDDALPENPDSHLDWVLHDRQEKQSKASAQQGLGVEKQTGPEAEMVELLRAEIINLQMDMLRMNRNLKNEIRKAVEPLIKEIRQDKQVIESQRQEIGRLRRGY